jgi:hypothetical protein
MSKVSSLRELQHLDCQFNSILGNEVDLKEARYIGENASKITVIFVPPEASDRGRASSPFICVCSSLSGMAG